MTVATDPASTTARQAAPARARVCRFCGTPLSRTFVDLRASPLCESFRTWEQLGQMEPFYPLHVFVCDECFLVQLEEFVSPEEIFTEYAYFSSYSDSWVNHARGYVEAVTDRFGLTGAHQVVEVASNDGYLLQHFVARGIPALGVEPATNVARVAMEKGVPTRVAFFHQTEARRMVAEGLSADLLLGNNVLAQVPDLNAFVAGLAILLRERGVLTLEFPHLMRLVEGNQFDTIYHEHFSYFSLLATRRILSAHGLRVFDVEEIPTHGGSLRVYACHAQDPRLDAHRVAALLAREQEEGMDQPAYYAAFGAQVRQTKRSILSFLIKAKGAGRRVVGYGAPGKGNTLLNYCGIRTDFLDYTVDRNPYKHGKYLPGTGIPVFPPDRIAQTRPDYVFILPWNLRDEIMQQLHYIRTWGGRFVVPIPELAVYT
ncbi:MAG: class I SAM-dependent methyltransferase [Candidatus Latescibacterota bacterium]